MKIKIVSILFFVITFFCQLIAQDIKRVAISTTDIIYVPQKDRIYATVPSTSSDPTYRNRLIVVDPYFGRIEASYFVGSDPSVLSVTNDGKFLYIGLRGTPSYTKFDLSTLSVVGTYSLGNGANITDPAYVEEIQTLHNALNTVVIARRNSCCSPRHEGVAVYDNGIKRLNNSPGHSGANSIAATEDSTVIWGYNNETTEFALRKLRLSNTGIAVEGTYSGLIESFGSRIKYYDGRVYATTGAVIDVKGTNPNKVGQFNITGFRGRDVVVDTVAAFVAMGGEPVKLIKFDKTTFTELESKDINNVNGDVRKLVQWGESSNLRFAFSTPEYIVIMGQCNSQIQTAPTVLTPDGLSVCQNDSIKLVASGNFDSYIWSNGAVGKEIFVRQEGLYSVAALDPSGCQSVYSPSVQVTIEARPWAPAISPSSNVSFCVGGSVRLSASSPNNTTVVWSNGAKGFEIDVNQAGNYSCHALSAKGCKSDKSPTVAVFQRADTVPPRPTIAVLGDTVFCVGASSAILTANPQLPNYRYFWSNGAVTPTITVQDNFSSGLYFVKLISASGCESPLSIPVNVKINSTPLAPRIFSNGRNLASSEETGNQWYLNGQLLAGVTQQFIVAQQSGFYQVRVIRNNCSSPLSEIANVTVSTQELPESVVSISPNPATDELTLIVKESDIASFEIMDIRGVARKATKVPFVNSAIALDISDLPNGFYIINFKSNKGEVMGLKKLVKL